MGALSLILGKKQLRTSIGGNEDGTLAVLVLDAAESIEHAYGATPTKNPIEKGSDISDHIRLENVILSINGIMAEAPLSVLGSAFNVVTGAIGSKASVLGPFGSVAATAGVGSISGLIANRNPNDNQFVKNAFKYLVELRDNRIPFNIVTSLQSYKNMVVTKLSFPQNAGIGGSLVFSATFEQIQLVETQMIVLAKVKNNSAASKQNTGNQPKKLASADNATIAKGFVNSLIRGVN